MEMTGRIENRETREDRLERLVESLSGDLGMLEGTVNQTVEMSGENAVSRTLVRTQFPAIGQPDSQKTGIEVKYCINPTIQCSKQANYLLVSIMLCHHK